MPGSCKPRQPDQQARRQDEFAGHLLRSAPDRPFNDARLWPTGDCRLSALLALNRLRSDLERQQFGVDFAYRNTRHQNRPLVIRSEFSLLAGLG